MSKSVDIVKAVVESHRASRKSAVAIVTAEVDPATEIVTPDDLFGAISVAVTKWIATGGEGELRRKRSGRFDVGDLADCLASVYLVAHLKSVGVLRLNVECHSAGRTHWDYDDDLYEENHLE